MSKRMLNKKQVETLLQNPNVEKCTEKSISYCKDFKVLAVRKYLEGLPPSEIFKQAQFDIDMLGRRSASNEYLSRWRKIFKEKGESGLKADGRGKSKRGDLKKFTNLTNEEKLKRLETEVAYLKEENRFLVKLRKKSLN